MKEKRRERGEGLRDHLFVAGVLVFALAAIFRADLFSGSALFFRAYRDINPLTVWYPWSRLELGSWQEGFFPIWNPYNLLGHPLLADYQSAVFSFLLWPLVFGPLEKITVLYLLGRLLLAGWGTWLFCRRMGMSRLAALASALSFGLTGYLVQHVNNQHIVIDLLLPFLLLLAEEGIVRQSIKALLCLAGVTALVLLGGQPGSALFTLALGYGYAFFLAAGRPRKDSFFFLFAAAALALLLSLIQLLPFLEFLPHAWTFHTASFGAEHVPLYGLIPLFAPGFYGPLDTARYHIPLLRLAPYLGTIVTILAAAAIFRPRSRRDFFFSAAFLTSLGLLAGLPPFSLIAHLPGLNQLTFIKYIQPLVAFTAAVLAGRMMEELRRGRGQFRLIAVSVTALGFLWAGRFFLGDSFPSLHLFMNGASLLASLLAGSLVLMSIVERRVRRALLSCGILVLLFLDLFSASLVNRAFPSEDILRRDFSSFQEIVAPAPLLRVVTAEDVLLPNQNLLLPFFMVGVSDALIIRESADLLRWFNGETPEEFQQGFLKYHSLRPKREVFLRGEFFWPRRWLGIGAEVSREPLPPNKIIPLLMEQAQVKTISAAHTFPLRLVIREDWREALFAHPPCCWIVSIPKLLNSSDMLKNLREYRLSLAVGVDPRMWEQEGDGVWFSVCSRREGAPAFSLLWARYLDPRRMPGERRWQEAVIDGPWGDEVAFATLPGERADHDWAVWGDPRISGRQELNGTLLPQRVKELRVYYGNAGDRARVQMTERIQPVSGKEEFYAFVAGRFFDPGLPVFVTAGGDEEQQRFRGGFAPGSAVIEKYEVQRVQLAVQSEGRGFVVLKDAYYPGWRVFVDGREARIWRVNHGLRGVEVLEGRVEVEFVYQPRSFEIGLWCVLTTVMSGAAILCWPRRRREEREKKHWK